LSAYNPQTQSPTCGYNWTVKSYTWTGISSHSFISTATSPSGHPNALLKFAYVTDPLKLALSPISASLQVQFTYNDYLGASHTVSPALFNF